MPPRPQPWYSAFNQPPRSPNGRNRKPTPPTYRNPAHRADPTDDRADVAYSWTIPGGVTIITPWEPPPTPAIPYAGVRAGELTGYRMWFVINKLDLCSIAHRFIWTPGATIEGKVDEVVYQDVFGFSRIYGGTYSYRTREELEPELIHLRHQPYPCMTSFPDYRIVNIYGIAIGTIKLWGEVIEHERGYRAQYAKLTAITEVIGAVDLTALNERYLP